MSQVGGAGVLLGEGVDDDAINVGQGTNVGTPCGAANTLPTLIRAKINAVDLKSIFVESESANLSGSFSGEGSLPLYPLQTLTWILPYSS